MPDVVSVIVVGLIGLLIGGVVNVLSDDLPKRGSLKLPHYPDDTPRPFIAWLGLTAFLFGKRTSPNGAKLSWRHPITEISTAIAMIVAMAATADAPERTTLQLVFWLAYMVIFVLITVIDVEHKLILFIVIIPSSVLAIIDALVTTPAIRGPNPDLTNALIGGALGFAIFFLLYIGGYVFTYVMSQVRNEQIDEIAFGYGDVMLITFSGLILGWQSLIFAIFLAVFFGAFGAIFYLVIARLVRGRVTMFTALPYGPYIVAGTVIMLLFSSEVGQLLQQAVWGP
jgi:prepilin signal peptidase PulO-like enzyme (type II secretory pathway)